MAVQHGAATENILPHADTFTVSHAEYNFFSRKFFRYKTISQK
jgi:hypothetical protein